MKRSSHQELTQRINQAYLLLDQGLSQTQVIKFLRTEFGVSWTQAYRYVQQAKDNKSLIPVPDPKKVFTVKLSSRLIEQIRNFSQAQGHSISLVVSQALEDFLKQKQNGQKKESQTS